jgi:hypothetical protein
MVQNPSAIDFGDASNLYEYALYEYRHNYTIYQSNDFTETDLVKLRDLASEQQFALNSPNSEGTISAIAGRTLARKVLQEFQQIIATSGYSTKLTLA